jgi:hypothetical protein
MQPLAEGVPAPRALGNTFFAVSLYSARVQSPSTLMCRCSSSSAVPLLMLRRDEVQMGLQSKLQRCQQSRLLATAAPMLAQPFRHVQQPT